MTGSLQTKNGKYYAVVSYKDNSDKRKQKWISTNLPVKGNKKKAEKFLADYLKKYEDKDGVLDNKKSSYGNTQIASGCTSQ